MNRAIKVRASVLASDPWQERDLVMPDVNSCTRKAAAEAYEMAGVGPDDINLIELHDCFATAEILHYENLGICKDGEAGRLIDEGEVAFGWAHSSQRIWRTIVQRPSTGRDWHRKHL